MNRWIRYSLLAATVAVATTALVARAQQAPAKPDISLDSPGIRAIQAKMEARFNDELRLYFQTGALGFGLDGLVEVRDAAAIPLARRAKIVALVGDDNRDRKAVYREIAVANGHPEWEPRIREIFAEQWIASARQGWWYRSPSGAWQQK